MIFWDIKILRYCFLSLSFILLLYFGILHFILGVEKNIFSEWSGYASIVLDVSKSMNVEDIWSQTRLSAAKQYIYNIIWNNPDYQFALTIFAWDSQRVLPFTSDINLIATFLSWIDSRNITQQGTNISAALEDGIASFGEEKTWVLLLISDGDESRIDISSQLWDEISNKNVKSFVVWVWSEQWWYVPSDYSISPYEIYNGIPVIAALNVRGLQSLASDINWVYSNLSEESIEFPDTWENTSQVLLQHNLLVVFSMIFWILFFLTVIIEVYFPKLLQYEKKL
jgi:hypothetical protein